MNVYSFRSRPSADSMSDWERDREYEAMRLIRQAREALNRARGLTELYDDVISDSIDILPEEDAWARAVDEARNG